MNEQLWWYVARASGLVAWILVAASVIWGLALSTRVFATRPRAGWVLDIHRYVGGLGVAYTGIHMGALVADSYAHFDVAALLVPLASSWRPDAVAWGILGFYLLVGIEISSLVKRYLPKRLWRSMHRMAFPLLVFANVHAFTAGTDTGHPVATWFAVATTSAVVFLLLYRGLTSRARRVRSEPVPSTSERLSTADQGVGDSRWMPAAR